MASFGYDGNLNNSFGLNGSRRAAVAAKNDVEARLLGSVSPRE